MQRNRRSHPVGGFEVKEITKYQADDGREFKTKEDCLAHELLCDKVAGIVSNLPDKPENDGCSFANGGGYLQHEKHALVSAKKALLSLANEISPHKWFVQSIEDDTAHSSWAGRIIDDSEKLAPINKAWYRIMCVDEQFREWGQPYFANNPNKAKQVRLNAAD